MPILKRVALSLINYNFNNDNGSYGCACISDRMDLLLRVEQFLLSTDFPQLSKEEVTTYLNYIRSVEGFSVEFAMLNPQGFFFYSLYTVAGFVDPTIGAGNVRRIIFNF